MSRRQRREVSDPPVPAPPVPAQCGRGPVASPERRLFAGIFERALDDLCGRGRRGDSPHRADVLAWIEADDTEWLGSFVNVCAALDWDPDGIRRALRDRLAA